MTTKYRELYDYLAAQGLPPGKVKSQDLAWAASRLGVTLDTETAAAAAAWKAERLAAAEAAGPVELPDGTHIDELRDY